MATSPKAAASASSADLVPAQLAKAALRRLVLAKLEPTPENYARAYQQEMGGAAPASVLPERAQRLIERLAARAFDGDAPGGLSGAIAEGRWEQAERLLEAPDLSGEQLADLIDRIVRGVERRSRQWTSARKKDSLHRVLGGSRGDAARLQQRLRQLVTSWDTETGEAAAEGGTAETMPAPLEDAPPQSPPAHAEATAVHEWNRVLASLDGTVQHALPKTEGDSRTLAEAIAAATERIRQEGATPLLADELHRLCQRADRVLEHRHHLLEQLGGLCRELTASLSDLAENDSWAKGQCDAMRQKIEEGLTARGVKSVSELLQTTRERQSQLRVERERARDALKTLINRMLSELDELGSQTGRFHESVGRYADVIEKADTLESLAGVVREMVEESRTVQALVAQTQQRLHDEHDKAAGLTERVNELEGELRRLSEEVSTDQLTQVANRRGLLQAFEAERSRMERTGSVLCVGLLDIDNFKRLNDELGHSVGDEALRSLAAVVGKTLRPTDLTARYGGEEFVVLLPDTPVEEGQVILTRLQRSLSGGLFMHEQKQIFVTFSAGVTAYRSGERLEDALERADQALYEAKRTGKNRTCIG
ncbi:sensor domain-containing diguanylate cyclase [Piscinibacter sp.]|uniref:sensor domain-containing diguanylate cyclase n=1 Tax=Piscinibacter sp. TaxID=1903157 RepID=UPI002C66AEC6|nr:diguanylate cyclase [Albitalea sp.]HUG23025.1 diguanylate cyclase [Albitalea sp.]